MGLILENFKGRFLSDVRPLLYETNWLILLSDLLRGLGIRILRRVTSLFRDCEGNRNSGLTNRELVSNLSNSLNGSKYRKIPMRENVP